MHVFVLESVRDFYNLRVNHAQFYVNGNTEGVIKLMIIYQNKQDKSGDNRIIQKQNDFCS